MEKMRKVAIAEAIVIVFLILIFFMVKGDESKKTDYNSDGLLSQRVYTGILPPESRLIFNFQPLRSALEGYIQQKNATIGVYVMNLRDGASMGINENGRFEPASLNKLPMAILVFRQIEKGELKLDTKLKITQEDVDPYSGTIYNKLNEDVSVEELLRAMLSDSDNTAFKVFSHTISLEEWNELSTYLDYYQMNNLNESVECKYYTLTPQGNSRIFTSLYLSTLLTPEHSEYILKQLTNSSFDIKNLAELPNKTIVAQKFGNYYANGERYFHSCGIIYIDDARLFYCVMTKGASGKEGERIIATIVRASYDYFIDARKKIEINEIL